jgi:hypothetical protein
MLPSTPPLRLFLSTALVGFGGLVALASCSGSVEETGRKCYDQLVAYAPPEGRPCGERVALSLEMCERTPAQRCTAQPGQNLVCLSSAGDHGFLVELSPCAVVESLPDGWTLAETYASGVNAQRECDTARTLCSGGGLPGGGGSGGTGGSGGGS